MHMILELAAGGGSSAAVVRRRVFVGCGLFAPSAAKASVGIGQSLVPKRNPMHDCRYEC